MGVEVEEFSETEKARAEVFERTQEAEREEAQQRGN